MKTPLRYQISEYDCGPTSLLNAVSYLFPQDQIPPEVIRSIMLYCLDGFGPDGVRGKSGTSPTAMLFLSNWLTSYGKVGEVSISSRYVDGLDVHLGEGGALMDALHRGGVVVLRLYLDVPHYVLVTGCQGEDLLVFDPYYWEEPFEDPGITLVTDQPCSYNRRIQRRVFCSTGTESYALGPVEERNAVVLFNQDTVLTEEATVEYFI